uniref:Cytochrome p450 n=1 Tax=Epiphyas postvittana TaxID=65032 RepID=A0A0K8TVP5_EPIPO
MIWYLLLLATIVVWRLYVSLSGKKLKKLAKEIGLINKPTKPILGHAYLFLGDLMKLWDFLARESIRQGGLAGFWNLDRLLVNVTDPGAAEFLLKTCLNKDHGLLRGPLMFVGNGSLFAPAHKWRPRRKILAPTFGMKQLNKFMDVFSDQTAVLVDQLAPRAGTGDFSIWRFAVNYTFDAVCETALGIQMQTQLKMNSFLTAIEEVFRMTTDRMNGFTARHDFMYKMLPCFKEYDKKRQLLYRFVDEIIKCKREEAASLTPTDTLNGFKKSKAPSILEMIMEYSASIGGYTDLELREETMVVILAGTDTSAVGTAFAFLMLSRHEEVQKKVYEELKEVFGDSDRPISAADLPKLKYLEVVIKEALRLYPPVPVILREVTQDVTLPSGLTLLKDVTIFINIWGIHRNKEYWGEDAEEFRPERFLEGPLKHPNQFVPFSHGVRNCLGYQYAMMSMKSSISSVLRRYIILPPDGMAREQLKEPLRLEYDVSIKHVDNFIIRIEKRNS